jgi:hypothetical protein
MTTTRRPTARYTLVRLEPRDAHLDLETFARAGRLHPELVRRLVALGLLEVTRDPRGELWFGPAQLRALARIQRLHAGFALDYAAVGLVTDLLDRIAELEALVRRTRRSGALPTGGQTWT